jgi:hypothetical protein
MRAWMNVKRKAVAKARRRLESLQNRTARPRRIKRQLARLARRLAVEKRRKRVHKVKVF